MTLARIGSNHSGRGVLSMFRNSQELVADMNAVFARADRAGRDLSVAERAEVEELIVQARSQKRIENLGRELGGMGNRFSDPNSSFAGGGGPGDRFIKSDGWKRISDPAARGQQWSSGLVEVGPYMMKGTLLEGTGAPGSGSGGGLVPVPQVVPGVVEKLFQPLTLETLLGAEQATTNTVRYALEGTATSGAAGVAEGGDKPQSTLGLSTSDEAIKKIATSLIVSDELAEDAPAVQSFINGRLSLFVRIESERQLLRGTSGGNEVQGLLTSRNVPVYAGGTAAGNRAVQLFKAMNGTRGSSFVEPEWVVMSPADYETIRLLQDSSGQFYGGGPFAGPYGGPQGLAGASGQVTGAVDSVWGKPVYVTAAIGAGTALIGSRAAATVWNRGGLSVEVTNSHSDLFLKNLLAIRAERRLGLSVYRSSAFCEVRLS